MPFVLTLHRLLWISTDAFPNAAKLALNPSPESPWKPMTALENAAFVNSAKAGLLDRSLIVIVGAMFLKKLVSKIARVVGLFVLHVLMLVMLKDLLLLESKKDILA